MSKFKHTLIHLTVAASLCSVASTGFSAPGQVAVEVDSSTQNRTEKQRSNSKEKSLEVRKSETNRSDKGNETRNSKERSKDRSRSHENRTSHDNSQSVVTSINPVTMGWTLLSELESSPQLKNSPHIIFRKVADCKLITKPEAPENSLIGGSWRQSGKNYTVAKYLVDYKQNISQISCYLLYAEILDSFASHVTLKDETKQREASIEAMSFVIDEQYEIISRANQRLKDVPANCAIPSFETRYSENTYDFNCGAWKFQPLQTSLNVAGVEVLSGGSVNGHSYRFEFSKVDSSADSTSVASASRTAVSKSVADYESSVASTENSKTASLNKRKTQNTSTSASNDKSKKSSVSARQ